MIYFKSSYGYNKTNENKISKSKETPAWRMSILIEAKKAHKEATSSRNRSENSILLQSWGFQGWAEQPMTINMLTVGYDMFVECLEF